MERTEADAIWRRIEAEARAQVGATMDVVEQTPLAFGDAIAWVDCLYGRTDALSAVHRVGFPRGNDLYTTCGDVIPHPSRWMTLSPALIRSLGRCRFCEAEHVRLTRENAA